MGSLMQLVAYGAQDLFLSSERKCPMCYKKTHIVYSTCPRYFLMGAVKMGHEECLRTATLISGGKAQKWATAAVSVEDSRCRRRGADLCEAAAERARPGSPHERILKDLLCNKLGATPDKRACAHAAGCGNADLLAFLYQERRVPWDPREVAYRAIIDGNSVQCLEYVCLEAEKEERKRNGCLSPCRRRPCDASLCLKAAESKRADSDVLRCALHHAALSGGSLLGSEAYSAVASTDSFWNPAAKFEKLDVLYNAGIRWGAGAGVTSADLLRWACMKGLPVREFPATLSKSNGLMHMIAMFSVVLNPTTLPTPKRCLKRHINGPRRGQLRQAIQDRGCVLSQAVCILGAQWEVARGATTAVKVAAVHRLHALRVVTETTIRVTRRRKYRAARVIQAAWLAYTYAPRPNGRMFVEAQSRWQQAVAVDTGTIHNN